MYALHKCLKILCGEEREKKDMSSKSLMCLQTKQIHRNKVINTLENFIHCAYIQSAAQNNYGNFITSSGWLKCICTKYFELCIISQSRFNNEIHLPTVGSNISDNSSNQQATDFKGIVVTSETGIYDEISNIVDDGTQVAVIFNATSDSKNFGANYHHFVSPNNCKNFSEYMKNSRNGDSVLHTLKCLIQRSDWTSFEVYNLFRVLDKLYDCGKFESVINILRNSNINPGCNIKLVDSSKHITLSLILSDLEHKNLHSFVQWILSYTDSSKDDSALINDSLSHLLKAHDSSVLEEVKGIEPDQKEIIKCAFENTSMFLEFITPLSPFSKDGLVLFDPKKYLMITKYSKNNIIREIRNLIGLSLNDNTISRFYEKFVQSNVHAMKCSISLVCMIFSVIRKKQFFLHVTQCISYCLLILDIYQGKIGNHLLEVKTSEGKSCILAITAATYAILGRKVDIVTSSSQLAQRDCNQWQTFYKYCGLKSGCNSSTEPSCYECEIVYGTATDFARDVLRERFTFKQIRNDRALNSCIVLIDEVDSLLLDRGFQTTYLSFENTEAGRKHLELLLTLVWMHVSQFRPLKVKSSQEIYFYGCIKPLHQILYDCNALLIEEDDPLNVLKLLTKKSQERGNMEYNYYNKYDLKSFKSCMPNIPLVKQSHLRALQFSKTASFHVLNKECTLDKVFSIESKSNLSEIKILICDLEHKEQLDKYEKNKIDTLYEKDGKIQVNETYEQDEIALATVLLSKEELKNHIHSQLVLNHLDIPEYLRNFVDEFLPHWIEHAFHALEMDLDRDYVVHEQSSIVPVDFAVSGMLEENKKWCNGLQQFLELKHKLPLSPIPFISNFLSNFNLFSCYRQILGVSGTIFGSQNDENLLRLLYSVQLYQMPTHKLTKFQEVSGILLENRETWLEEIRRQVNREIDNNRAVLILCEDIKTADELKKKEFIASCRSNIDPNINENEIICTPRDVIVTTNLGSRGTDYKINNLVERNYGLYVIVTFLPCNMRVQRQAYGRAARNGTCGSATMIVNNQNLPYEWKNCKTIHELVILRDKSWDHEKKFLKLTEEINKLVRKEYFFKAYCNYIRNVEQKCLSLQIPKCETTLLVNCLHEKWTIWLEKDHLNKEEIKLNRFDQRFYDDLEKLTKILFEELDFACSKLFSKPIRFSPTNNFYHLLHFADIMIVKGEHNYAIKYCDTVINEAGNWNALAFYKRAFIKLLCKPAGQDYIKQACDDLQNAKCKLLAYKTELLCKHFLILLSCFNNDTEVSTTLTAQIYAEYHSLLLFDKNIVENVANLTDNFASRVEKMSLVNKIKSIYSPIINAKCLKPVCDEIFVTLPAKSDNLIGDIELYYSIAILVGGVSIAIFLLKALSDAGFLPNITYDIISSLVDIHVTAIKVKLRYFRVYLDNTLHTIDIDWSSWDINQIIKVCLSHLIKKQQKCVTKNYALEKLQVKLMFDSLSTDILHRFFESIQTEVALSNDAQLNVAALTKTINSIINYLKASLYFRVTKLFRENIWKGEQLSKFICKTKTHHETLEDAINENTDLLRFRKFSEVMHTQINIYDETAKEIINILMPSWKLVEIAVMKGKERYYYTVIKDGKKKCIELLDEDICKDGEVYEFLNKRLQFELTIRKRNYCLIKHINEQKFSNFDLLNKKELCKAIESINFNNSLKSKWLNENFALLKLREDNDILNLPFEQLYYIKTNDEEDYDTKLFQHFSYLVTEQTTNSTPEQSEKTFLEVYVTILDVNFYSVFRIQCIWL